jgi:tetratricopeptide (TPR) repeat protein
MELSEQNGVYRVVKSILRGARGSSPAGSTPAARSRFLALAPAGAALALLPLLACGRFSARMELKKGNAAYVEGKYQKALDFYKNVPEEVPERAQAALNTGYAHMAQYRFGSKHPKDREHAKLAVESYEEYLKRKTDLTPEDAAVREKVEEYIITLLADAEEYGAAIDRLQAQLGKKPNDPALLRGIASTYDKWDRPTKALEYFQKWSALFPNDSAPHTAIAAYCWNMSYRRGQLMAPTERNRWVDFGLDAAAKAVQVEPESVEAVTYKNLLLRERAKMRVDPDEVAVYMAEAKTLLERAKELRAKQKEAEAAKAAASPSPAGGGA